MAMKMVRPINAMYVLDKMIEHQGHTNMYSGCYNDPAGDLARYIDKYDIKVFRPNEVFETPSTKFEFEGGDCLIYHNYSDDPNKKEYASTATLLFSYDTWV